MNISCDSKRVTFKTVPKELFEAEKSGTKPNTVRILDIEEYHQLRKHNPKKIIIQHQQEIFIRTITNIHVTEGVFGKVIVVISWTNEEHHHALTVGPHSVPGEPGDHNVATDKDDVQVPSMPSICACVNCIRGMQEEGVPGPTPESPTKLDELAPVLLPQTLIEALGRHRRGKSHADFVKELLIAHLDAVAEAAYRDKRAEERGPMHD